VGVRYDNKLPNRFVPVMPSSRLMQTMCPDLAALLSVEAPL